MQVRVNESTLSDIAQAIREKNKETDKYKPSDMPDAIGRILVTEVVVEPKEITDNGTYEVPEGVHGYNPVTVNVQPDLESITITENGTYVSENADGFSEVTVDTLTLTADELVLTGNCQYKFANNSWASMIKKFGDKITTQGITNAGQMFNGSNELESIPFDLNFDPNTLCSISQIFYNCTKLTELPRMYNLKYDGSSSPFSSCYKVREVPEDYFDTWDVSYIETTTRTTISDYFANCYSLRKQPPHTILKAAENNTQNLAYYYSPYSSMFNYCYSLDEIVDLPVGAREAKWTSNGFSSAFYYNGRLKRLTFATDNGQPYKVKWSKQTIKLDSYIGYSVRRYILENNSGITEATEIKNAETYQALKDNPDSWTSLQEYSRYNHDSAVETINSLPDASENGGNTILFWGNCGSATDGGAIRNLTEAEIAVATEKGWTVTIN